VRKYGPGALEDASEKSAYARACASGDADVAASSVDATDDTCAAVGDQPSAPAGQYADIIIKKKRQTGGAATMTRAPATKPSEGRSARPCKSAGKPKNRRRLDSSDGEA
jgi:hypothetical protein